MASTLKTFRLSDEFLDTMNEIKKRLKLESQVSVLRTGVSVLEELTNATGDEGASIIIRSKDGKERKVIVVLPTQKVELL